MVASNTKITDKKKLAKMIDDGKSQVEIAEFFGCSKSAVCHASKKLLSRQTFDQLTPKQKLFCEQRAAGSSKTDAALIAYEVGSVEDAKSLGKQLSNKPEIEMAITELLTEAGLTKRYRMQKLKQHVDHESADISLKALDQTWKLDGSYAADKLIISTPLMEFTMQDREELRLLDELYSATEERAAEIQARLRELHPREIIEGQIVKDETPVENKKS